MADRLLRHKPTGTLYIWQHAFAERDDFEEVIDVEAKEVPEPPKSRKRKGVDGAVEVDEAAIAADASRNLP
jgi:hypothetical protein